MIHKAIITAALMAVSFTACAQDSERIEMCQNMEGLAKAIMQGRQLGVPMSEAYATSTRSGDETITKLTQLLVREAYRKPQYQTDQFKQQEVNEFGSSVFLACIGDK